MFVSLFAVGPPKVHLPNASTHWVILSHLPGAKLNIVPQRMIREFVVQSLWGTDKCSIHWRETMSLNSMAVIWYYLYQAKIRGRETQFLVLDLLA